MKVGTLEPENLVHHPVHNLELGAKLTGMNLGLCRRCWVSWGICQSMDHLFIHCSSVDFFVVGVQAAGHYRSRLFWIAVYGEQRGELMAKPEKPDLPADGWACALPAETSSQVLRGTSPHFTRANEVQWLASAHVQRIFDFDFYSLFFVWGHTVQCSGLTT